MLDNKSNSTKKTVSASDVAIAGMFTALICVGAYISIPTPLVPITLQLAFCVLSALLLGGKLSFFAVCAYILAGLIGLPVFSGGGGGFAHILKPSFGYIIGFAVAAAVGGNISGGYKENPSFKRLLVAAFTSLAIIHVIGTLYLFFMCNYYLDKPITLWQAAMAGTIMFLPSDSLWCFLSALLCKKINPLLNKSLSQNKLT